MKSRYITKTKDNSSTLFVPGLDEHYHSIHGALQESKHVFIEAGLHQFKDADNVRVLEIGFGTGLNALLTAKETEKFPFSIEYSSIEKYPVNLEELAQLNYKEIIEGINTLEILENLHQCNWEKKFEILSRFDLIKYQGDLKTFNFNHEYFDLIYFDAFAPSAQAELWTIPIFQKMYDSLRDGGMLVTYCVKGEVRRNMQAAGFKVEKIPGPPGKREMARALKLDSNDT